MYLLQQRRKEGAIAEAKRDRATPPAGKYVLLHIYVLDHKIEAMADYTTVELCAEVANQVQVTNKYTCRNTKFGNMPDALPTK